MITSIFGIVAILVALLAIALQRFYSYVPAHELKRLAARGDQLARALYRPVAYGESLRVLLWLVAVAALTTGFGLLMTQLSPVSMAAVVAVTLVMGLVLLPAVHLTVHAAHLAAWSAPALDKLLSYVHGPLGVVATVANRYRGQRAHSGLYEKEDFAALLEQQAAQSDNRLSSHHVKLMHSALHFHDKKVADIVLPRAQARLLDAKETLGPILLDELHKSEQSIFLVYQDKPDTVVGTITMKAAATAKQGGQVGDFMQAAPAYANQEFTLAQVADAFMHTKQLALVVVNNFAEVVGIVTLEKLLHEVFGDVPETNLTYEDREAVAAYEPQPDLPADEASDHDIASADAVAESATSLEDSEIEPEASSPEATEVVE
jgi:CBS domain containing-hemolysin-like protein